MRQVRTVGQWLAQCWLGRRESYKSWYLQRDFVGIVLFVCLFRRHGCSSASNLVEAGSSLFMVLPFWLTHLRNVF